MAIYPREKGFKVQITINDASGAAVNLSGATVVYKIKDPEGSDDVRSATIDNAASGITSYVTPDTNQFVKEGVYKIQPQITLSNGNIFYGTSQDLEITSLYK